MNSEHTFNPASSFCTHCGAAEAEVEDGLRLECRGAKNDKGEDVPFRTFGVPGGDVLRSLFYGPAPVKGVEP